jgi:hypothetical protein
VYVPIWKVAMAVSFQSGSAGVMETASFCSTPKENVQSA